MRFYCTSTGPIGGLNCEVLLYFNWSHRWSQPSSKHTSSTGQQPPKLLYGREQPLLTGYPMYKAMYFPTFCANLLFSIDYHWNSPVHFSRINHFSLSLSINHTIMEALGAFIVALWASAPPPPFPQSK